MGKIHRNTVRMDVLCLLSLVCDAQGEESAAFEELAEAVTLAEYGGFIRNFVDLGQPMADLLTRLLARAQVLPPGVLLHVNRIWKFLVNRVRNNPILHRPKQERHPSSALPST